MLNKSRLCDAVGKTITGIGDHYEATVLAFSDGTYVALRARERYGDCEIVEVDILNTDYWEARTAAVKAGVWTNEEEIEQKRKKMEEREAANMKQKRQQYERLRRELGE